VGTVTAVDRDRGRVTFSMEAFNPKGTKVIEARVVGIPFQVEIG